MNCLPFTKVALPYGWLGSMSPHPIQHFGVVWRTAEALFQAMRFDDAEIREEIRTQASPIAAKLVAKKHHARMVLIPGGPSDLDNMRRVIRFKVEQHPDLAAGLKATGDAVIIEDVSSRPHGRNLFWGAANRGPTFDGPWEGENWLGKLWMELRARLAGDAP